MMATATLGDIATFPLTDEGLTLEIGVTLDVLAFDFFIRTQYTVPWRHLG